MKQIFSLILTFSLIFSYAQEYSFAKKFNYGKVILKDGSTLEGELKWFPSQNDNLKFRKSSTENTVKYKPTDVISFSSDNLKFVPLFNFKAYADSYALVGILTTINETFGEVVSEGKFNIYFTLITGYNAVSRTIESYPNFVFQDSSDPEKKLVAYPYMIRMKDKKYEKAKENLYILFKDYPEIVEKIKAFKKENDFIEIIKMVEELNK